MFDLPEGIGPVECVNVEHEEALLVPRWIDCERVTFRYGLGDEFIGVLKMLNKQNEKVAASAACSADCSLDRPPRLGVDVDYFRSRSSSKQ